MSIAGPGIATAVTSVFAGFVYLAILSLSLRLGGQRRSLRIFAGAAIAVYVASLAMVGTHISFWHFSSYFGAAVVMTIFIYGTVLKSLSVDILRALSSTPRDKLSLDELAQAVSGPAFAERADLLVTLGFATVADGRYMMTEAGRKAALRIRRYRRIVGLDSSGLYGFRTIARHSNARVNRAENARHPGNAD